MLIYVITYKFKIIEKTFKQWNLWIIIRRIVSNLANSEYILLIKQKNVIGVIQLWNISKWARWQPIGISDIEWFIAESPSLPRTYNVFFSVHCTYTIHHALLQSVHYVYSVRSEDLTLNPIKRYKTSFSFSNKGIGRFAMSYFHSIFMALRSRIIY